jgi:hypothetical protein
MEVGVSIIVCGHDATQQNLAATHPTPTYRCAASPEQVITTIKHDQRLSAEHLSLDFMPETIDNALATTDRCARGMRPALG